MAWFRSGSERWKGRKPAGGRARDGVIAALVQFACLVLIAASANAAESGPIKIAAFGDSLTAGYELPARAAFPAVLERRLRADGFAVEIANAGVSGDTSAGGLARLDWSTPEGTDLVIVELGANDMLRGAPPAGTVQALTTIIKRLQARKIVVVLAGMRSIDNWGAAYRAEFDAIYPDLARRFDAPLYPFFMEGVSGNRALTLPDGLHPNVAGVEKMVEGFAPFLEKTLLERFGARAKTEN
ncbi:MAG: arylesterase [Rhodoblastus sp.]